MSLHSLIKNFRVALPIALALAGILPSAFTSSAQTAPPPSAAATEPFTLKSLGHGVFAAIDDAKGDAGANAGFVIGDDGVLVIDTFQHEAAAKLLLADIRKITKLPIKFVVNTHYHVDHVAGNHVFEDAGAVVLAQSNVRPWIHTENLKFYGKDITAAQKAEVEALGSPSLVYDSGVQIFLGKVKVIVSVFPGHTGGDSIVILPDANIIFCGDLFWRKTLPNLIDASTDSWITTLNQLSNAAKSNTIFVSGHGDPGNSKDVDDFRDYLKFVRANVAEAVKNGKEGDDLLTTVMPGLKSTYGKWDFFDDFAKSNITDTAAELRGKKIIPQPAAH